MRTSVQRQPRMYRRFYDYETNRIAAAVAARATARAEALIFPYLFPQSAEQTFFRVQGNFGVYFAQGRHALIEKTDVGYIISDLKSRNGTKLNSSIIKESLLLSPGDVIDIAGEVFVFDEK